MDLRAKLDDRHLIEHALKVMRSNPRTFPEDRVRKLLALSVRRFRKAVGLTKRSLIGCFSKQSRSRLMYRVEWTDDAMESLAMVCLQQPHGTFEYLTK